MPVKVTQAVHLSAPMTVCIAYMCSETRTIFHEFIFLDGETLYGLISWGQHCGFKNRPGVYVRVNHYIDWIYEKINESLLRF